VLDDIVEDVIGAAVDVIEVLVVVVEVGK